MILLFTICFNRDGSKWLDYGRPGTVPCKGETLSNGAFFRWFHERLEIVMEKVRSLIR